jgi:addiction module HigA family antidote
MTMKNPPHQGLSVRHDCIEPLGLTITEAAAALGVTRQTLNNLVNGKSGISADMAIRIDKAFGGGAETWLRRKWPATSRKPASTKVTSVSSRCPDASSTNRIRDFDGITVRGARFSVGRLITVAHSKTLAPSRGRGDVARRVGG